MLPFLVDVTGNSLDLYDTLDWWDDLNHFVNWLPLLTGLGLIICGEVHPRWAVVLLVAGLGRDPGDRLGARRVVHLHPARHRDRHRLRGHPRRRSTGHARWLRRRLVRSLAPLSSKGARLLPCRSSRPTSSGAVHGGDDRRCPRRRGRGRRDPGERAPAAAAERKAVLHVHGFCDYFFQTAAADCWTARATTSTRSTCASTAGPPRRTRRPTSSPTSREYYAELDAAMQPGSPSATATATWWSAGTPPAG